jgi:restriction system protein
MARGGMSMPRSPAGGVGRSQPPRRTTGATTRTTAGRRTGAPDPRLQRTQQQRQQAQYAREAQGARRRQEAEHRTAELRRRVERLESILSEGLRRSARIDLDALHQKPEVPAFDPGELAMAAPEPSVEDFEASWVPRWWGGKAGRERRVSSAGEAYQRARADWETAERERQQKLAEAQQVHDAVLTGRRAEAERYNLRIARVAAGLRNRDPRAVESFLRTVLARVPLPAGFPRRVEVRFDPDQEQVTLRVVLPGREVIPTIAGYEFEPPDEIRPVPRLDDEIERLYQRVVAQVALLVVRDLLDAEPQIERVTFDGLVDSVDAAGRPGFDTPISFQVDRETFAEIEVHFDRHTPEDCLHLLDTMARA